MPDIKEILKKVDQDNTVKERESVGGLKTVKDMAKDFNVDLQTKPMSGVTYNEQSPELRRLGYQGLIETGKNYEQILEALQSDSEAWGRGLKTSAKGFINGAIQNLASWDFSAVKDMATNDNRGDFGNWLSNSAFAKWAKDTHGLEIYKTGDNFGTSKYWANFIGQQGFTLGIIAEMFLEQYAIKKLNYGLLSRAGATSKTMNNVYNALTLANGAYSGVREAWMNGLETQENVYNKYKQLGFSDEFAKEAASEAASEAFNMEYKTVSLLNGLQALTLFGRFKLGAFERGLAKNPNVGFSGLIETFGGLADKVENKFFRSSFDLITQGIAEGFEEGVQTGIQTTALNKSYKRKGLTAKEDMWNEEMRDSILMGALSGGLMGAAGKVGRILDNNGDEKRLNQRAEDFTQNMYVQSKAQLQNYDKAMKAVDKAYSAYVKNPSKSNFNALTEAKKELAKAKDAQAVSLTMQALAIDYARGKGTILYDSHIENMQRTIDALESNDTKKLVELGLLDEAGNSQTGLTREEMLDMTKRDLDRAKVIKQRLEDTLTNKTEDLEIAQEIVSQQGLIDYISDDLNENNKTSDVYRNGNSTYQQLSDEGKELHDLYAKRAALKLAKKRGIFDSATQSKLQAVEDRLREIAQDKNKEYSEDLNNLFSPEDEAIMVRNAGYNDFIANEHNRAINEFRRDRALERLKKMEDKASIAREERLRKKQRIENAKSEKEANRLAKQAQKEQEKINRKINELEKKKDKAKSQAQKDALQSEIDSLKKKLKEEKEDENAATNKAEKEAVAEAVQQTSPEGQKPDTTQPIVEEEAPSTEEEEVAKTDPSTAFGSKTEAVTPAVGELYDDLSGGEEEVTPPNQSNEDEDFISSLEDEGLYEDEDGNIIDPNDNVRNSKNFFFESNKRINPNSRSEEQNEKTKRLFKNLVDEIKEKTGKENIDPEDVIRYLIKTLGYEEVDNIFPNLVYAMELSEMFDKNYNYTNLYNKFFNVSKQLSEYFHEITTEEDLVDANDEVAEDVEEYEELPEANVTSPIELEVEDEWVEISETEAMYLNNTIEYEDTMTNRSIPKAGYVGVPYVVAEEITDEGGVIRKRYYTQKVLNDNPNIDNHYVLDPSFLNQNTTLDVEIPDNAEDIDVTEWYVENGKLEKRTIKFGEYMKKHNIQKGSDEYYKKVPMIATKVIRGKKRNIFFLQDYQWYNRTNISNRDGNAEDIIKEGAANINAIREGIAKGNNKIRILKKEFGKFFNVKEMYEADQRELINLNEASKGSILLKVGDDGHLRSSEGIFDISQLSNNLKKLRVRKGLLYEARPVGIKNGKMQYLLLSVKGNNPTQGEKINKTAFNNVKYGILASFLLNNRNSLYFVNTVKNKYGLTLSKAEEIRNAYKRFGIDIMTDIRGLMNLYTSVSQSDERFLRGYDETISKALHMLVTEGKNGSVTLTFKEKKNDSDTLDRKEDGGIDAPGMTIVGGNDTNKEFFLRNFDTLFEGEEPLFYKAIMSSRQDMLGRKDAFFEISDTGDVNEYKSSNGENTYDSYLKDNFKTNVQSFDIEGVNGKNISVVDIQPMIFYKLANGKVSEGKGKQKTAVTPKKSELPNPTPTPTETPNTGDINTATFEDRVKEMQKLFISEMFDAYLEDEQIYKFKKITDFDTFIKELRNLKDEFIEERIHDYYKDLKEEEKKYKSTQIFESEKAISYNEHKVLEDVSGLKIDGLTLLEYNEVLNYLFYSSLEKLSQEKTEGFSTKDIFDSFVKSLNSFNEKIEGYDKRLEKLQKANSDGKYNRQIEKINAYKGKYEKILEQKEKLIGDNGAMSVMFTRFFGDEINLDEIEDLEDKDNIANDNGEIEHNYSKSSLERKVTTTFSKNLKILLSTIKKVDNVGDPVLSDSMGLYQYEPIEASVLALMDVMVSVNNTYEDVIKKIDEKIKSQSGNTLMYKQLLNVFTNVDEKLQNEILYKMSSNKLTMYMILMQKDAINNIIKLQLMNANYLAADVKMFESWKSNFEQSDMFIGEGVDRAYDIEKLSDFYYNQLKTFLERPILERFEKVRTNQEIDSSKEKETAGLSVEKDFQKLKDILAFLKINISDNTIKYLLEREGNNLIGSSSFLYNLQNSIYAIIKTSDGVQKEKSLRYLNNFNLFEHYTSSIKDTFVDAEIELNGSSIDKSYRIAGKSIQSTIQEMFSYEVISELKDVQVYKENGNTEIRMGDYIKDLLAMPLTKNNYTLQLLIDENYSDVRNMIGVNFVSLESIKKRGEKLFSDGKLTKQPRINNILAQIGFFQNTMRYLKNVRIPGFKGISFRMGKVLNPTISDKDQMILYNLPLVDIRDGNLDFDISSGYTINNELAKFLTQQLFESELDRIISSLKNKTDVSGYDDARKFFTTFPEFNNLKIDIKGKEVTLWKYLHSYFKDKRHTELPSDVRETILLTASDYLKSYVKEKSNELYNNTEKTGSWVDNGFISIKAKEATVENDFLDSMYLDEKRKGVSAADGKSVYELAAIDFIVNSLLSKGTIHHLIVGDTAMYAKDNLGKFATFDSKGEITDINFDAYIDSIGENITKRMALAIAPGNKLANSNHDFYTQIMVNDPVSIATVAEAYIKQYYGEVDTMNKAALDTFDRLHKELQKAEGKEVFRVESELNKVYLQVGKKFVGMDSNGNFALYDTHKEDGIKFFKGFDGIRNFLQRKNKEIAGYFEIEGTDAQEYTTWKEHLDILWRQGRITKDKYNKVYNALEKGESLSSDDLKVIMQPIKPVYTGKKTEYDEKGNPLFSRIIYIKSSSIPLLPQVTAGLPIDKIRRHMEDLQREKKQNVRLSYQTANKVGSMKTNLTVDHLYKLDFKDLYDKETGEGLLTRSSIELDRQYFRIQQDTPYKTGKHLEEGSQDKIIMGSQFWKILMGNGINKIEEKIFPNTYDKAMIKEYNETVIDEEKINPDENLSGVQLDKMKNFVEMKLMEINKVNLYKELGLDLKTNKPQNVTEFYEKLSKVLIKEANARGYSESITESFGVFKDLEAINFNIPLWLSSESNKIEALLQAIIANRLITMKLPGNAFYTSSNEGFSSVDKFGQEGVVALDDIKLQNEKSKIAWIDGHNGELKATYIDIKDGKKILKEAEVLIQSKFRIKDKDGKERLIDLEKEGYAKRDENGNLILNTKESGGKYIEEELMKMFSFRIPTSSHQSGAILKVVGFLPEEVGDLIVVPKEHTKQIGEDYDIDKRYIYLSHNFIDSKGNIRKIREGLLKEYNHTINEKIDLVLEVYNEETLKLQDEKKFVSELSELSDEELFDMLKEYGIEVANRNEADDIMNKYKTKILDRLLSLYQNKQEMIADLKRMKTRITESRQGRFNKMLYENAIIDSYKSLYQTNNVGVQNNINKILSTSFAKETANAIDEKFKEEKGKRKYFSLYDYDYQIDQTVLGASGKLGIGVHSNFVTLLAQLQRLESPVTILEDVYDSDGKVIGKRNKVIVIGELVSSGVIGGSIYTLDGERMISEVGAENQNSATDNVKEQIMGKRNENAYTINVLIQLTLRGFDKTKDVVTLDSGAKKKLQLSSLFISQPIIRRYVELKEKYKSFTKDFSQDIEQDILKALIKEFNKDKKAQILYTESGEVIPTNFLSGGMYSTLSSEMTGQALYDNLTFDSKKYDTLMQLAVLQKFMDLNREADQIASFQKLINLNTNKLGVSYFNTLDKIKELNNLNDSYLQNIKSIIGDFVHIDNVSVNGELTESEREYIKKKRIKIDVTEEMALEDLKRNKESGAFVTFDETTLLSQGYVKIGDNYIKATTPEGKTLVDSIRASQGLFDEIFPYNAPMVNIVRNRIINSMEKELKGEALLDLNFEIMSNFKDFLLSTDNLNLFEGSVEDAREELFFDRAGNESLAGFINRMRNENNPIFRNNSFLKTLEGYVDKKGGVSIIKNSFEDTDSFLESIKYNDFLNLLLDGTTIIGNWNGVNMTPLMLAQNLISYSYLSNQEGNAIGFKRYVNQKFLEIIGVNNYMRLLSDKINRKNGQSFTTEQESEIANRFVRQYFQHNPQRAYRLRSRDFNIDTFVDVNENEPLFKALSKLTTKGSSVELSDDANAGNGLGVRKVTKKDAIANIIKEIKNRRHFTLDLGISQDELPPIFVAIEDESNTHSDNKFVLLELDDEYGLDTYHTIATLGDLGYNEYNYDKEYVAGSINPIEEYTQDPLIVKPVFEEVEKMVDTSNAEVFLDEVFNDDSIFSKTYNSLKQFLDPDLKVVFKDSIEDGNDTVRVNPALYHHNTNTIYLNKDMLNEDVRKNGNGQYNSENWYQEVILEEFIHSITVGQMFKYGEFKGDNYTLKEDAPDFMKKLVALHELAKEALPFRKNEDGTTENYQNKNLAEFVAGVFYSREFRHKLSTIKDKRDRSLFDKFKDVLRRMLLYITGKNYNDEVIKATKELLKDKNREMSRGVTTRTGSEAEKETVRRTKTKKILRKLNLTSNDEAMKMNFSLYSPSELSRYSYNQEFAIKMVEDFYKGKKIIVRERGHMKRNAVEDKYADFIVKQIQLQLDGRKFEDYVKMTYSSNKEFIFLKIKPTFVSLIKERSANSLSNNIQNILSEDPSMSTQDLINKLKEVGLVKDC